MDIIKYQCTWRTPLNPLDMTKVQYIILHHIDAKGAHPDLIHEWHLKRGENWKGIGYNEYIRKDGTVYICRGDNEGAHTENYNSISYGIAVEGDYQVEQTMPEKQYKSLVERVKFHTIRLSHLKGIVRHKDVNSTVCPGKWFPYSNILNDIKKVTYNDALDMLHKFFNYDVEYWRNKGGIDEYFDDLMIRFATQLQNKKLI